MEGFPSSNNLSCDILAAPRSCNTAGDVDSQGDGKHAVDLSNPRPNESRVSPAPPRAPRYAHQRVHMFRSMGEVHQHEDDSSITTPPYWGGGTTHDGGVSHGQDAGTPRCCSRGGLEQQDDSVGSPIQFVTIVLPSTAARGSRSRSPQPQAGGRFLEAGQQAFVSIRGSMSAQGSQTPTEGALFPLDMHTLAYPNDRFMLSPRLSNGAVSPAERDDDDADSLRTASPVSTTTSRQMSPAFEKRRHKGLRERLTPPAVPRDTGLSILINVPAIASRGECGVVPVEHTPLTSSEQFILYDD
jgi:hypothetical protein